MIKGSLKPFQMTNVLTWLFMLRGEGIMCAAKQTILEAIEIRDIAKMASPPSAGDFDLLSFASKYHCCCCEERK